MTIAAASAVMRELARDGMTMLWVTHEMGFAREVARMRLRRMLRPGGLLRLWDVVYDQPEDAEDRLEAWCASGGDGIVGEWSRAELEEHVREEHSTFA